MFSFCFTQNIAFLLLSCASQIRITMVITHYSTTLDFLSQVKAYFLPQPLHCLPPINETHDYRCYQTASKVSKRI